MKKTVLVFLFIILFSFVYSQENKCKFICYTLYDLKLELGTKNFFLGRDSLDIDLLYLIKDDSLDSILIKNDYVRKKNNLLNLNCDCFTDSTVYYDSIKYIEINYKWDSLDLITDSINKSIVIYYDDSVSRNKWGEFSSSPQYFRYEKNYVKQVPYIIFLCDILFFDEYCFISGVIIRNTNVGHPRFFVYCYRKEEDSIWLNNIRWGLYKKYY